MTQPSMSGGASKRRRLSVGLRIKDKFLIGGSVRQREEHALISGHMNVSGLHWSVAHRLRKRDEAADKASNLSCEGPCMHCQLV